MELADLTRQADDAWRHLASLNARARYLPERDRDLLTEAIEEFTSTLEELSTAEEKLRHLQKIEAFSRLTGGVVHDVSFLLPAQQARFKNKLIADLLLGHVGAEGDSVPLAAEIFGIDLARSFVDAQTAAEKGTRLSGSGRVFSIEERGSYTCPVRSGDCYRTLKRKSDWPATVPER